MAEEVRLSILNTDQDTNQDFHKPGISCLTGAGNQLKNCRAISAVIGYERICKAKTV